jgi:hypothetical protein
MRQHEWNQESHSRLPDKISGIKSEIVAIRSHAGWRNITYNSRNSCTQWFSQLRPEETEKGTCSSPRGSPPEKPQASCRGEQQEQSYIHNQGTEKPCNGERLSAGRLCEAASSAKYAS